MADLLRPLVEAARRGERKALNELAGCSDRFVRMFHGSLSQHVRKAHGSTIDFVLEGLAEALAELDRFEYRSDEQFYAWIARAVQGRIIDAWRREGRRKRAGRPLSLADDGGEPDSRARSPSQLASADELRREVARHILELHVERPREMEAVVLKAFDGMSWAQIRRALGLSSDRVGRTLFAGGIELLRPRLERALGATALDRVLGG